MVNTVVEMRNENDAVIQRYESYLGALKKSYKVVLEKAYDLGQIKDSSCNCPSQDKSSFSRHQSFETKRQLETSQATPLSLSNPSHLFDAHPGLGIKWR